MKFVIFIFFLFFFSSRRRHTRLQGDWSSDVCSSDLLFDEPLSNLDANLRESMRVEIRRIQQELRSEERRVGKECRSRRSPEHQKKKKEKENKKRNQEETR